MEIARLQEQIDEMSAKSAELRREIDQPHGAKQHARHKVRPPRTVLRELRAVANAARENGIIEILRGLDKTAWLPLSIDEYALLWDEHLASLTVVRHQISALISQAGLPEPDAQRAATSQSRSPARSYRSRTVLSRLSAVAESATKRATTQMLAATDSIHGVPLAIEGYALHWDECMATLAAVRDRIAKLQAMPAATTAQLRRTFSL
jgi:hypothetical protein